MRVKNFLPQIIYKSLLNVYNEFLTGYKSISYSQEGEDLILRRIFDGKEKGFYVDVGAHHPKRFSNTYLFYKMGWRGINIEPRPGSKKIFDKVRKNDINIEAAISDTPEELTYFFFNEPALNSFDRELSLKRVLGSEYRIIREIKLNTTKLSEILERYVEENQVIDFLSIDTEGFDLSVLKSNNWDKFKPTVILCEDAEFDLANPYKSKVFKLLSEKNYQLLAKTPSTLIFKKLEL